MLILHRKREEALYLDTGDGRTTVIRILAMSKYHVKIGIAAAPSIIVTREELIPGTDAYE